MPESLCATSVATRPDSLFLMHSWIATGLPRSAKGRGSAFALGPRNSRRLVADVRTDSMPTPGDSLRTGFDRVCGLHNHHKHRWRWGGKGPLCLRLRTRTRGTAANPRSLLPRSSPSGERCRDSQRCGAVPSTTGGPVLSAESAEEEYAPAANEGITRQAICTGRSLGDYVSSSPPTRGAQGVTK